MSFSADVKIELSKINNLKNKDEVYAELQGYLSTANFSTAKNINKFSTENEYNINRFAKLLNNVGIVNYKIDIQGKNYIITFNNSLENIDFTDIMQNDKLSKIFVRGAFLGSGSINNPQNKYHLEIILINKNVSNMVKNILEKFNIRAKILEKEKYFSIYIKDGEEISKFLALIGANTAVLKFEEIRVIRDMKNKVNRLVNCETANLNKTLGASVQQIADIKKIREKGIFDKLPKELKEIAILREENPNATLEELGSMLSKPIGKSSVNNRFKRIREYL